MRSEDSKILAGNKNKAVALLRNAGFNIPGPVAYATDLTKMILSQSYTISQEQRVNNTEYLSIAEKYRDGTATEAETEQLRKMVDEAAEKNGYENDTDWRMDHKAPNSKYDVSISQADVLYGNDGSIYSNKAVYYYGDGRSYDQKAIKVLKTVRNNPEARITVYRAVPNNRVEGHVRNGDWVTITKEYAEEHGERILDGEYRIIQNDVPAKYVYANGDSIHEYGYDDGADYKH